MHHKQARGQTRRRLRPYEYSLDPELLTTHPKPDIPAFCSQLFVQEALLLEQGRLQKLLEAEKQLLSSATAEPKLGTEATAAAATAGMAPEFHGPEDSGNGADAGDQGVSADPLDAFMTDLSTQMDTDKVREQAWCQAS